MNTISIETERIRLKSITPALIHHLFETSQKEDIKTALGLNEAAYEKYKQMHEGGIETYKTSSFYFLLINKETGFPIGECGFHTWYKTHNRAEVFYILKNEEDKRNGYLTEVLPVVLDFGFNELHLHRIEAFVADWNTPSVKLLQRNNFVKEGTMKQHYYTNGQYEDSDCYALIKSTK